MAKATLVSWRFTFNSPSIPGPPSPHTFRIHQCTFRGWVFGTAISKTLVRKPRICDFFFWCLCVSVKQWPRRGYSFWLSALVFAHLCSCSHKNLWNTVRRQQSSLITSHDALTARRAKHMLWALVHRCGNMLFFLERVAWSRPVYPNFEHEYATVSFGACVSVKQWPRAGRACGPSALLFVSLAAVSANISETRFHCSIQKLITNDT